MVPGFKEIKGHWSIWGNFIQYMIMVSVPTSCVYSVIVVRKMSFFSYRHLVKNVGVKGHDVCYVRLNGLNKK